jgi:hypothetical protein
MDDDIGRDDEIGKINIKIKSLLSKEGGIPITAFKILSNNKIAGEVFI